MTQLFPDFEISSEFVDFKPTRTDGLRRLEQFLARTGRHYASTRNYDFGEGRRSNVSALSPWLRHRLVTEEELLVRVLAQHSPSTAEKFVQEVFWRTYFKGWLEQRPSVWAHYQRGVMSALEAVEGDVERHARFKDALAGNTSIDCFDSWVQELVTTGYLHNHARMWFASIWIFTLRLPWQLGADFFLRHLLDGDPASNTLSWRWVGGLHTKGKTYLARPDNITKYTEGRFRPKGLATFAEPLDEYVDHPRIPIASTGTQIKAPYVLLLTEEDLSGAAIMSTPPVETIGLLATHGRSPRPVANAVDAFAMGSMNGVLQPEARVERPVDDWSEPLIEAAQKAGVTSIVTPYAPTGPARSRLDRAEPKLKDAGVTLCRIMRPYDSIAWPHAKAGYFGLKKKIPTILSQLKLAG